MITFLKNLPIRLKISAFVIPSTIAFGILMTMLTLYFLNDYKSSTLSEFKEVVAQVQQNGKDSNIDSLLSKMSQKSDQKIENIGILFSSIVIGVIVLAAIGAIVISGLIAKPVKRTAKGLENISSGDADLTQRLPVNASDETGKLCCFFNMFLEKLQGTIKQLQGTAHQLNDSANSIHLHITGIQEKTQSADEIAQTVYRSASYMRNDMREVSSVLEESTETIHVISSAINELTQTVDEISETSGRAHSNTENAKMKMEALEENVQQLGKAGEDISKVTETIAEISDQVNLLALNATIEAARAGEAGKGFAVVANEIKALAHQTADAATEIQRRIEQVQKVTGATIEGIIEATALVSDNTAVVSTIASAVEEQSATVSEIGGSIGSASEKLDTSYQKISKASEYADEMATMMTSVSETISEVDKAVSSIRETSQILKDLADDSAKNTQQFRT